MSIECTLSLINSQICYYFAIALAKFIFIRFLWSNFLFSFHFQVDIHKHIYVFLECERRNCFIFSWNFKHNFLSRFGATKPMPKNCTEFISHFFPSRLQVGHWNMYNMIQRTTFSWSMEGILYKLHFQGYKNPLFIKLQVNPDWDFYFIGLKKDKLKIFQEGNTPTHYTSIRSFCLHLSYICEIQYWYLRAKEFHYNSI